MKTSAKKQPPAKRPATASKPKTAPPKGGAALVAVIEAAKRAAHVDDDPARAFAHFRPLAQRVSTEGLAPFTGQPLLMLANVRAALAAVEPHLEAAASRLTAPDFTSLFELPSLVLALDYAAGRVPLASLSGGEIAAMLREGAPWRELVLQYLEVASHPLLNLVPEARVRAIRKGHGKLDSARDFAALPGLFAEFEGALAGKHPFAQAEIDRLGALGAALLQELQPGAARVQVPTRAAEAILRDQFGALVEARYDALEVVAAVALGRKKGGALLPALRSFTPGPRAAEPVAGDAPAPDPAEPTS